MHNTAPVPDNGASWKPSGSQPDTPKPGTVYRVSETLTAPVRTALNVRDAARPSQIVHDFRALDGKQLFMVTGAQDYRDYHAYLCVVMPSSDSGSAGTITMCLIVAFESEEAINELPMIHRHFSIPVSQHLGHLARLAGEPHLSLPPRFLENAYYIAFPYPFKSHRAAMWENTGHILASAELADLIDSCQRKKEEWQALLSTNPEEFVRYREEYEKFLRPLSPSPLPPSEIVSPEPNPLTKAVPLATVEVVETEPMSDSPVDPRLHQRALTPVVAEST